MRWAAVLAFALFVPACGGGEPALDAGLLDCRPVGRPPGWTCPAGCVPNEARHVDIDRSCVTDERVLVWCRVDGSANGEEACFEQSVEGQTIRVVSGSSQAFDGVHEDAITAAGWTRCDQTLGPALPRCN